VVNGCDAESLNCAQPAKTSSVEQSAVSPRRPDHHDCMQPDYGYLGSGARDGVARVFSYLPANGGPRTATR
jgi:hypothetical protein